MADTFSGELREQHSFGFKWRSRGKECRVLIRADLLRHQASPDVRIARIVFVVYHPPAPNHLCLRVSKGILEGNPHPHALIEVVDFLLYGLFNPGAGKGLGSVLVVVLLFES